uniref:Macaca fascicularis brain cDNA clone: QtrA-15216, similar to human KIAA2012 protein (LOC339809), mRNA, RefSeq: XM_291020.1 n=1 Tax=Macaca fascicularis TaxID=9541 RepID=I7GKN6_MACFA|nr:unnamed protein product [Macaca fascicularis]
MKQEVDCYRLASPKSRCWLIHCVLRAHFLVHRLLPSCSVLTWQNGQSSSLGLYTGTNPILEGSTFLT